MLRVFYAVNYHGAPSGIPDSYSVRKDLLEIEKLQEECACLMKYRLTGQAQVKEALEDLKYEETMYKGIETPDAKELLTGLRKDKRLLRRVLKRDVKESLVTTKMQTGTLQLPKQLQNILREEETKGEDLTYGTIGNHAKSLR